MHRLVKSSSPRHEKLPGALADRYTPVSKDLSQALGNFHAKDLRSLNDDDDAWLRKGQCDFYYKIGDETLLLIASQDTMKPKRRGVSDWPSHLEIFLVDGLVLHHVLTAPVPQGDEVGPEALTRLTWSIVAALAHLRPDMKDAFSRALCAEWKRSWWNTRSLDDWVRTLESSRNNSKKLILATHPDKFTGWSACPIKELLDAIQDLFRSAVAVDDAVQRKLDALLLLASRC